MVLSDVRSDQVEEQRCFRRLDCKGGHRLVSRHCLSVGAGRLCFCGRSGAAAAQVANLVWGKVLNRVCKPLQLNEGLCHVDVRQEPERAGARLQEWNGMEGRRIEIAHSCVSAYMG